MKIEFHRFLQNIYSYWSKTHVIVIGKALKHHMDLYGYQGKTHHILNKQNWFYLKTQLVKCTYSSCFTKGFNFLKILKTYRWEWNKGSLIDHNYAGYETYWLVIKAFSGEHETPISVMASRNSSKNLHQCFRFQNPT